MLYLWMPEGQGQWLWQLDDSNWQIAESLEQLIQTVKAIYNGTEAIVFFPSQSAQFYTQPILKAQYKQLKQQGIQYLIEEYSIEPVEHLAVFHDFFKDQLNFMAIPQNIRDTYQQSLSLLPWQVQSLLPDFLLLPEPEIDSLSIAQVFDRQILRWSKFRGWSFDDPELLAQLALAPKMVNFYQVDDELVSKVQLVLGAEVDYKSRELSKIPLSYFKHHPFNILLKTKHKQSATSHYWKACAVILCLAIAVQVSYDLIRWWKYRALANQTVQLAIEQYQQWFPDESRITEQNLQSNFKAKLGANSISGDRQALELLSRVGPILQQANILAEEVNYQNGHLNMSLLVGNSQMLNQLVEQFKQQGFTVELGAIRNQGSQVLGMVKVQ